MSLLDRICTFIVRRGAGGDFRSIAVSLRDINDRQAIAEVAKREAATRQMEGQLSGLTSQAGTSQLGSLGGNLAQSGVNFMGQGLSRGDAA